MGSHGDSVLESGRATAVQPSGAAALLFSRQEAHAILWPRSGRIRARCELVGRSQLWPEELTFKRKTGRVAVGTRISPRPPHRSRRALLTHRAPPSGQTSCDERFSHVRRPTRSHYSDRRGISAQCPNRGRLTAVPLG